MASIPPVVDRCQTCGAELPPAAAYCWLCRTPRGEKRALHMAPATAPPKFVAASNFFSYGLVLGAAVLLALMCAGLVIDSRDNAAAAIVLALVGGVPLLAALIRTVSRHQQTGSASFTDTLLTLLAYWAITVALLALLAVAAVGALVVMCFYMLSTNQFR